MKKKMFVSYFWENRNIDGFGNIRKGLGNAIFKIDSLIDSMEELNITIAKIKQHDDFKNLDVDITIINFKILE